MKARAGDRNPHGQRHRLFLLDFDAAFRAADTVPDAPWISSAALESSQAIDRLLDQAADGEPDVWHVNGLEGSGTWDKVRRLAADAIRELGPLLVDGQVVSYRF